MYVICIFGAGARCLQVRGEVPVCPRDRRAAHREPPPQVQDRHVSHLPQRWLLPLRTPLPLYPLTGRDALRPGQPRQEVRRCRERRRSHQTAANVRRRQQPAAGSLGQQQRSGPGRQQHEERSGPAQQFLQHGRHERRQPRRPPVLRGLLPQRLLLLRHHGVPLSGLRLSAPLRPLFTLHLADRCLSLSPASNFQPFGLSVLHVVTTTTWSYTRCFHFFLSFCRAQRIHKVVHVENRN